MAALAQLIADLARMSRDQADLNHRFLEGLLAQASSMPYPTAPFPLSGVTLHRLTEENDPQMVLKIFETSAGELEWAIHLLPLLVGEAQTTALGLRPGGLSRR